jgi:hypothetical protein
VVLWDPTRLPLRDGCMDAVFDDYRNGSGTGRGAGRRGGIQAESSRALRPRALNTPGTMMVLGTM